MAELKTVLLDTLKECEAPVPLAALMAVTHASMAEVSAALDELQKSEHVTSIDHGQVILYAYLSSDSGAF